MTNKIFFKYIKTQMQNTAIRNLEAQMHDLETVINERYSEIKECNSREAKSEDAKEKADIREEKRQLREDILRLRDREIMLQRELFTLRDEKARLNDKGTQIQVAPVSETNLLRNAARKAFEVPYNDSLGVVQTLVEAMQKCRQSWQTCENPDERLYAPYIAVVQGSMMGKTRMFFTLHQHEKYVFYICLRADGSYPTGIPEVIQALTSETCTEGYYAAFILNALKALNDFKSKQDGSMSTRDSCFKWFELQQNLSFWKPILGEKI